jgi:hypothetical protein
VKQWGLRYGEEANSKQLKELHQAIHKMKSYLKSEKILHPQERLKGNNE